MAPNLTISRYRTSTAPRTWCSSPPAADACADPDAVGAGAVGRAEGAVGRAEGAAGRAEGAYGAGAGSETSGTTGVAVEEGEGAAKACGRATPRAGVGAAPGWSAFSVTVILISSGRRAYSWRYVATAPSPPVRGYSLSPE
ncbi:MAG TPA: hypothetical protein VI248_21520 [Kineosporiaceae bacterium]